MKIIRRLSAALLLLLTAAVFVSCGYKNPDPDKNGAISIGAMNGPTMIGLAKLDRDAKDGKTVNKYTITKEVTPDAITAGLSNRSYDAAALPLNNAAVIFNSPDMEDIQIAAVNTLNVLCLIAKNSAGINSLKDLSGKKVCSSGKGAIPEYVFKYLLEKNGVLNVNVEFYSDPADIVAGILAGTVDIALLPQPAATTAVVRSGGSAAVKLNLADEWKKIAGNENSEIITGVLVVRKAYLKNNKETFDKFLGDYKASIEFMAKEENLDAASQYVVDLGIIPALPIAKAALPQCGLAYIGGTEMKEKAAAFLTVLYGQNKDSIGGKIPGADFYYPY